MNLPAEPEDISEGFDMGGLLEQAMTMQRQMMEAQERLAATEITGESGGGLVRVVLTGDFDVRSVHIDPAAVDADDTTLLADLVAAAFRNAVAEAIRLQTSGMGVDLPDVGQLLEGLGGMGLPTGEPGDSIDPDGQS